jgi:hypothetical protein
VSKQRSLRLTRATFKRYLDTGWMPKVVAGSLMTRETVNTFARGVSAGTYKGRRDANDNTEVRTEDVLMLLGKSGTQLLAELFPRKRKKAGQCKPSPPQRTKAQIENFRVNWHKLHRKFGRLIATPYEDVGPREMRLFHQLMSLAWRAGTFKLCMPAKDLQRLSNLDHNYLPMARARLVHWGVIAQPTPVANGGWYYTLLNPKTKQPFAEPAPGRLPVQLPDSWALDELLTDKD